MAAGKKLSPARRRAIQALVSASTIHEAAAQARVREDTLWRWLAQDEDFQSVLKQERSRRREVASIASESLLQAAVETLERVLCDEGSPDDVRVEAARTAFEVAAQLYKITVLDERVSALEVWTQQRRAKRAEPQLAVAADRTA